MSDLHRAVVGDDEHSLVCTHTMGEDDVVALCAGCDARLNALVAQERERCARIAEDYASPGVVGGMTEWSRGWQHSAEAIAAEIREGKAPA